MYTIYIHILISFECFINYVLLFYSFVCTLTYLTKYMTLTEFNHIIQIIQMTVDSNHYISHGFNFTFRYIDDVLSLNNPKFGDYVDFIYPAELEIKDTTDSILSASYLDIMLFSEIKMKINDC